MSGVRRFGAPILVYGIRRDSDLDSALGQAFSSVGSFPAGAVGAAGVGAAGGSAAACLSTRDSSIITGSGAASAADLVVAALRDARHGHIIQDIEVAFPIRIRQWRVDSIRTGSAATQGIAASSPETGANSTEAGAAASSRVGIGPMPESDKLAWANRIGVLPVQEQMGPDGAASMAETARRRVATPAPPGRHRPIMARDPHRRATGLRRRVIAVITMPQVTVVHLRITAHLRQCTRVARIIPRRDPTQCRARASRRRARSPLRARSQLRTLQEGASPEDIRGSQEGIRAAEAADVVGSQSITA